MIKRRQYRGCLKPDVSREELKNGVEAARLCAATLIQDGVVLNASLYCHDTMCFLYCESMDKAEDDNETRDEWTFDLGFLSPLEPFLESWPEETGRTFWAPMYPVYYHSRPESAEAWEQGRTEKTRVGRIAFLYPERLSSYVRWHQALVDEGLFLGDKYQFISLHENLLFSYFEEPKTMVSIRGEEKPSSVIEEWKKQLPETHFDRTKTEGSNFLVIPALFSVGRSDL